MSLFYLFFLLLFDLNHDQILLIEHGDLLVFGLSVPPANGQSAAQGEEIGQLGGAQETEAGAKADQTTEGG